MHKLEETIPYAFPIYLKCWQQSVENSFSENPHLHIYCKQWIPANMQILYLMLFVSRVFNTMHMLLWVAYQKSAHKKQLAWKHTGDPLKFRLRYPYSIYNIIWRLIFLNIKNTLQCILETIKLSILDTHSKNFLFECISYACVGPKELDFSLWYRSGFRTFLACIYFNDITKIPKVSLFKSIFLQLMQDNQTAVCQ